MCLRYSKTANDFEKFKPERFRWYNLCVVVRRVNARIFTTNSQNIYSEKSFFGDKRTKNYRFPIIYAAKVARINYLSAGLCPQWKGVSIYGIKMKNMRNLRKKTSKMTSNNCGYPKIENFGYFLPKNSNSDHQTLYAIKITLPYITPVSGFSLYFQRVLACLAMFDVRFASFNKTRQLLSRLL